MLLPPSGLEMDGPYLFPEASFRSWPTPSSLHAANATMSGVMAYGYTYSRVMPKPSVP